ncbi:MAG TPA: serine hydrolase domain-containing protein [Geminicoccus sp.]|uniref:serine hydrolase domain-containing protein n=1 Tax=Geminicoccus sp. TaxID=2024832 RepID=UPI002E305B03|nr:serine hydrolase domain-containing protein [Geminicoccus sp.]HEX2528122.1 serine hydrolase domain-containing protein [Geminicoccus sp.]
MLRAACSELTTDAGFAGIAIIQGERCWTGSITFAGPREGNSHRFLFYSFTKTIMAAAVLRLVARGDLELDAPAGRWLDGPATAADFTLRQLLAHTSGLGDYGALPAYQAAVRSGEAPWSRAEYLARAEAGRLLFEPGRGWRYSNVGYMLVKDILEKVGAAPLGRVLDREIFAPLGVRDVSLPTLRDELRPFLFGRSSQLGGRTVAGHYHPGWVAHGVAGGTPEAATRILHGLMTGKLLPPELLAQMRQGQPVGGPIEGRPWRKPGYGLGLMIELDETGTLRPEGHTGGGPGCSPAVYHFADSALPFTLCAVTNGEDGGQAERMVWSMAAEMEK